MTTIHLRVHQPEPTQPYHHRHDTLVSAQVDEDGNITCVQDIPMGVLSLDRPLDVFDMDAGVFARMWINQPEAVQEYHSLHGTEVMARITGSNVVSCFYVVDGNNTYRQALPASVLSPGWPSLGM